MTLYRSIKPFIFRPVRTRSNRAEWWKSADIIWACNSAVRRSYFDDKAAHSAGWALKCIAEINTFLWTWGTVGKRASEKEREREGGKQAGNEKHYWAVALKRRPRDRHISSAGDHSSHVWKRRPGLQRPRRAAPHHQTHTRVHTNTHTQLQSSFH